MSNSTSINIAKKAAALAAVELIKDGMTVGLGTGSTTEHFITHLAERCRKGLNIHAVATSERSSIQAKKEGIPIIDINSISSIDIDIDGADEIDTKKRLIKGGGGAAFREKIVACMSKEFVVIADNSKLVEALGSFPLPVEILPFGHTYTIAKLKEKGYPGNLRVSKKGEYVITDNGNYIFDVELKFPCNMPEKENDVIKSVVGVIETGFFISMASRVVLGFSDGHVEILE